MGEAECAEVELEPQDLKDLASSSPPPAYSSSSQSIVSSLISALAVPVPPPLSHSDLAEGTKRRVQCLVSGGSAERFPGDYKMSGGVEFWGN